ncbi:tetratricopeptide repeat protein [Mucilaginibacter sp. RCC_168]|uniref:tetratricopeptide repeat protein n=1 Tax=Mucilaginibacter sp. RCC_168 TaxID=3239221 RepID=UPI0035235E98
METIDIFKSEFSRLLAECREKNEFEFVNVLLGYKGMGDIYALTHFYESDSLFTEFPKLMSGDFADKNTVRLGLFLYCHFFEMDELYRVVGNLVNIANGGGFQPFLFDDIGDDDLYPREKIAKIREPAVSCGFEPLMNCFDLVYSNQLRNSFFHSNYSISEGNYVNTSRKHEIIIGGQVKQVISIEKDLAPLISETLDFAQHFFSEIRNAKLSYKQNKVILGKLGNIEPIVLLGDAEKGLIGWESSSGSAIKFTDVSGTPYLGAWNIRINSPNRKTKELGKRLNEIVDKDSYITNDPALLQLEKEIVAHFDRDLVKQLAIPFYNWGNNTVILAKKKKSEQECLFLLKNALARYDQAISHESTFAPAHFNKILTEKEIDELSGIKPVYFDLYNQVKPLLEADGYPAEVLSVLGDYSYQAALGMNDAMSAVNLFKESANHYQALSALEPENCDALFRMGHSLWKAATYEENGDGTGDTEKAKAAFRASLRCSPSTTKYAIAFADLLEFCANYLPGDGVDELNEAISVLSSAIIMNPGDVELFYKKANRQLSLFQRSEGQQEKERQLVLAKSDFETAIQGNDHNQRYLNNYGVALLELGRNSKRDDSEALLRKAISIMDGLIAAQPEAVNSYLNKANALIRLYDLFSVSDELNNAKILCATANGLQPNSADFLLNEIAARS